MKLESEISRCVNDLTTKNLIISQLEDNYEKKASIAREEMSKNPNFNKEIADQNKKLKDISRQLEKDINNERLAKLELERSL